MTYDFKTHVRDYEDFQQLSESLNAARKALFRNHEALTKAERTCLLLKVEHERALRRALIASTAKNESQRKAEAAIATEELELKRFKWEQVVGELTRESFLLKKELDMLTVASNNFRSQVR